MGSGDTRTVHLVSPRVLLFLQRDGRWLLLRGAPQKWFAGKLDGLGGHIEPGEDVLAAAYREAEEECGLRPLTLRLAATVQVTGDPPVALFVHVGTLPAGNLTTTDEGEHVWCTDDDLGNAELSFVPDVPVLIRELTAPGAERQVFSYALDPPDKLTRTT